MERGGILHLKSAGHCSIEHETASGLLAYRGHDTEKNITKNINHLSSTHHTHPSTHTHTTHTHTHTPLQASSTNLYYLLLLNLLWIKFTQHRDKVFAPCQVQTSNKALRGTPPRLSRMREMPISRGLGAPRAVFVISEDKLSTLCQ